MPRYHYTALNLSRFHYSTYLCQDITLSLTLSRFHYGPNLCQDIIIPLNLSRFHYGPYLCQDITISLTLSRFHCSPNLCQDILFLNILKFHRTLSFIKISPYINLGPSIRYTLNQQRVKFIKSLPTAVRRFKIWERGFAFAV